MSIPMMVVDNDSLYMAAYKAGYNSQAAGHSFNDGVVGPISAEQAKALFCTLGCTLFKVAPGCSVRWVPNGDLLQAFYETEKEHASRMAAAAKAEREAEELAALQAKYAARAAARDQAEAEAAEYAAAKELVAAHEARLEAAKAPVTRRKRSK